jgi:AcrR family transcriptional regulator
MGGVTDERRRLTRAEAKAQRLEDLLAAAEALFLRNGYFNTTLDEIAAEAGMTKGAVYSNFASKEELFLTFMERERPHIGDVPMFRDPELTPSEAFRQLGEVMASRPARLDEAALALEIRAVVLRSETARSAYVERIRPALEALAADIERQRDNHHLTVTGLESVLIQQALADGLLMLRALLPELFTPTLIPTAMQLVASLFPPDKQHEPGAANIAPLAASRALEAKRRTDDR